MEAINNMVLKDLNNLFQKYHGCLDQIDERAFVLLTKAQLRLGHVKENRLTKSLGDISGGEYKNAVAGTKGK